MKKNLIFAMLISLAATTGFVACDDDTVKQELQAPSVSETSGTYQSLDFKWEPTANTIQYGYKLYDPDELVVESGVTKETSVHFSDLLPSTTYKLLVWAFAGLDTDYSTSPAAELTATTAAIIKLGTPANLAVADNNGSMTVSWDAVENAMSYSYSISNPETGVVRSGNVTETSVRISGLDEGDYTFSVTAETTEGGFISSDAASVNFSFETLVAELWRTTATYYSDILGKSWNATLIAYSDGTYSIPAFYGVEGYDFNFSVNDNGILSISSGTPNGNNYRTVPTGVAAAGDLFVYMPGFEFTGFDGSSSGGDLWIGYYDQNWNETFYTDTFNWTSSTSGGSTTLTIDDIVGTYDNHSWGTTWITDDWTAEDYDEYDWTGTIEKTGANTVTIDGLYYDDEPVSATFDESAQTITIEPQTYSWYVIAASTGVSDPIVAKIGAGGVVTFPEYSLYYDGYVYLIAESVFTPQTSTRSTAVHTRNAAKKSNARPARK